MKAKYLDQLETILNGEQIENVKEVEHRFVEFPQSYAINFLFAIATRNRYFEENLKELEIENLPKESLPIIARGLRDSWESILVDEDGELIEEDEIEEGKKYEKDRLCEVPDGMQELFKKLESSAQSFCSKYNSDHHVVADMIFRKCLWLLERRENGDISDDVVNSVKSKIRVTATNADRRWSAHKLGFYNENELRYVLPLGDDIHKILKRLDEIKSQEKDSVSQSRIDNEKIELKISVECIKEILNSLNASGINVTSLFEEIEKI